jgi:hypothetical protein
MSPSTRLSRRAISLGLAAVLAAVNVGAPLLDLGRDTARVEIVGDHDGGGGAIEHDHLLCIQHSASGWMVALTTAPPADSTAGVQEPSHDDPGFPDRVAPTSHQPRAPPFA